MDNAIKTIEVGDNAPKFVAESTSGKIKLSDLKGKNVILYFYPKDDTPGCTIEAQDFNSKIKDFSDLDCVIIGISKDSMKSHNKFIEKYDLQFDLLADESTEICQSYCVLKEKAMFGKKYTGIDRSTFLINKIGKITKIWKSVKVKGHVEEVFKELKKL